jgi:hypothetical protein
MLRRAHKPRLLALFLVAPVALAVVLMPLAAAPPPAIPPPTGVDGVIGPEWAGVTPTVVPYDGISGGSNGDLVAYKVYTRADANYLYVALQAVPAVGDQWNTAFTLGNTKGNVYLDTDLIDGSDLLLLMADTPPDYCDATDTNCNSSNVGPAGPHVYVAYTPGSPGGTNDSPPGVGAVQELAISWDVLHNDPDAIGFPKVVCKVNVRTIQAFGNNFAGAQFGTNRFGTFSSCAPPNVYTVDYFANANTAGAPDATVRLINDGTLGDTSPTGDLCAAIYVFDNREQMQECCSCKITPNGYLALGVNPNLTSNNPGKTLQRGVIKVISSTPPTTAGLCDATSISEQPGIRGWMSHLQKTNPGFQFTEGGLKDATLDSAELADLQEDCVVIAQNGVTGVCSCADVGR